MPQKGVRSCATVKISNKLAKCCHYSSRRVLSIFQKVFGRSCSCAEGHRDPGTGLSCVCSCGAGFLCCVLLPLFGTCLSFVSFCLVCLLFAPGCVCVCPLFLPFPFTYGGADLAGPTLCCLPCCLRFASFSVAILMMTQDVIVHFFSQSW